ncbi:hypothetical protein CBL_11234 [Carabus blaptoides fortunei]
MSSAAAQPTTYKLIYNSVLDSPIRSLCQDPVNNTIFLTGHTYKYIARLQLNKTPDVGLTMMIKFAMLPAGPLHRRCSREYARQARIHASFLLGYCELCVPRNMSETYRTKRELEEDRQHTYS